MTIPQAYKRPARELLQQFSPETAFTGQEETILNDILQIEPLKLTPYDNTNLQGDKENMPPLVADEAFKRMLYPLFSRYFHKTLPWGILTGVKPVKFYKKALSHFDEHTKEVLAEKYFLRDDKIALLNQIWTLQAPLLARRGRKHISVYVGIPICPMRCSYCSFVSTVMDKKRTLLTDYLTGLKQEIQRMGKLVRDYGLIIDTLYIGGGTPSVLNAEEALALLTDLKQHFDLTQTKEITFEAGRPDTTTPALLAVLKNAGVTRICVNPQTFHEQTLTRINRPGSEAQITHCFEAAREAGIDNINMDLILGLPGENEQKFLYSLKRAIALNPENITVHDLSVKKGTVVKSTQGHHVAEAFSEAFYEECAALLANSGYEPYYMYRQKYTVGNGENVGYTKKGRENLYNIFMMAEEQSILGIGAGSSGKLYYPEEDRFEHVYTVKDIRTYNARTEETIVKKEEAWTSFLHNEFEKTV